MDVNQRDDGKQRDDNSSAIVDIMSLATAAEVAVDMQHARCAHRARSAYTGSYNVAVGIYNARVTRAARHLRDDSTARVARIAINARHNRGGDVQAVLLREGAHAPP
jgi:hypothetical protein